MPIYSARFTPQDSFYVSEDANNALARGVLLSSDGLSAAIVANLIASQGLSETAGDALAKKPGFSVSSLFFSLGTSLLIPSAGGWQTLEFFEDRRCLGESKSALVAGGSVTCLDSQARKLSELCPQFPYEVAHRKGRRLARVGTSTRAEYWYELFFRKHIGFGFLIDCPAKRKAELEAALALLAESSFGGRRSLGKGSAEFVGLQIVPFADVESDLHFCLGLVNPSKTSWAKIDQSRSRYELVARQVCYGSTSSGRDVRSQRMTLLAEASVLAGEPKGRVLEVASGAGFPSPRYRDGKGLCIRVPESWSAP